MIRDRNTSRFSLVCVGLLWTIASAVAEDTAQPANLRVLVPADARLLVEGKRTRKTGAIRRFVSPPLQPGKKYHYTFQWSYRNNGETVTRTKIVYVRAGESKEVDLTAESKGAEPKLDVPFVPTPQDVVDKMLQIAVLRDKDVVYDLGCGDGRIVVTAAKKYGCKAAGFDLDPRRIKESLERVKAAGVEKLVRIEKKNLFDVDLRPASVVTLYLLPSVNKQLIPQLEKLKAGTRILSHNFPIKGIKPRHVIKVLSKEDRLQHTIYVWITPLQKEKK